MTLPVACDRDDDDRDSTVDGSSSEGTSSNHDLNMAIARREHKWVGGRICCPWIVHVFRIVVANSKGPVLDHTQCIVNVAGFVFVNAGTYFIRKPVV